MSEPRDLVVGTLSGGVTAVVGGPGVIEPVGVDWRVEWWIGAEDRWHRPAVETTTRQRSLPAAPVVETSVRVPGGDITATVGGVMGPGATAWTVIEVSNRSAVPVALGWTVQGGSTGLGPGVLHRIDGRRVVLGRSPRSIETPASLIPEANELPAAIAVQPLAHTAVAWLAIEGADALDGVPGEELPTFPPLDRVIAGWAPFEEIGARVSFGDDTAQAAAGSDRAVVRLGGEVDLDPIGAATVARAATLLSADAVAEHQLEHLAQLPRRSGAVRADDEVAATVATLRAWCVAAWRRLVDPDDMVLPVAAAATWLVKQARRSGEVRPDVVVAVTEAIATLGAHDQAPAAAKVAGALAVLTSAPGPSSAGAAPAAASNSPSGSGTASAAARRSVVDASARCGGSIDLVVRVDADGIELLPGWVETWWGRAIEGHDLPTPWGPLSFALRWHGERPALLWEVLGAPPSLRISATALDAGWRSTGAGGEELLAAVDRPVIASFS